MRTYGTKEAAALSGLPKTTLDCFARDWRGYMLPAVRGLGRGRCSRWSAQQVQELYVIAQIRLARREERQLARDLLRDGHAKAGSIGLRLDGPVPDFDWAR